MRPGCEKLEVNNPHGRLALQPSMSLIRSYLAAVTAGAAVGLVDYALGLWMSARGLHAEATLLDEWLLAVFTGALVLVIELSHKRDQKRMNEKLRTIELMNHHVRNALNVIVASAYAHGHDKQLNEIRISVNRIEWALREILPGRVTDDYSETAPDKPRMTANER